MRPLMLDRQVLLPPGYPERSCLLVRYRLPGLRHCYVLCHEPGSDGPDVSSVELMSFFLQQAEQLATDAVNDPQAFMLIHSGASIRKRSNWHLHVFIVQNRWQKAWVYTILGAKNFAMAGAAAMRSLEACGRVATRSRSK
jgi:hypothetical protein